MFRRVYQNSSSAAGCRLYWSVIRLVNDDLLSDKNPIMTTLSAIMTPKTWAAWGGGSIKRYHCFLYLLSDRNIFVMLQIYKLEYRASDWLVFFRLA